MRTTVSPKVAPSSSSFTSLTVEHVTMHARPVDELAPFQEKVRQLTAKNKVLQAEIQQEEAKTTALVALTPRPVKSNDWEAHFPPPSFIVFPAALALLYSKLATLREQVRLLAAANKTMEQELQQVETRKQALASLSTMPPPSSRSTDFGSPPASSSTILISSSLSKELSRLQEQIKELTSLNKALEATLLGEKARNTSLKALSATTGSSSPTASSPASSPLAELLPMDRNLFDFVVQSRELKVLQDTFAELRLLNGVLAAELNFRKAQEQSLIALSGAPSMTTPEEKTQMRNQPATESYSFAKQLDKARRDYAVPKEERNSTIPLPKVPTTRLRQT